MAEKAWIDGTSGISEVGCIDEKYVQITAITTGTELELQTSEITVSGTTAVMESISSETIASPLSDAIEASGHLPTPPGFAYCLGLRSAGLADAFTGEVRFAFEDPLDQLTDELRTYGGQLLHVPRLLRPLNDPDTTTLVENETTTTSVRTVGQTFQIESIGRDITTVRTERGEDALDGEQALDVEIAAMGDLVVFTSVEKGFPNTSRRLVANRVTPDGVAEEWSKTFDQQITFFSILEDNPTLLPSDRVTTIVVGLGESSLGADPTTSSVVLLDDTGHEIAALPAPPQLRDIYSLPFDVDLLTPCESGSPPHTGASSWRFDYRYFTLTACTDGRPLGTLRDYANGEIYFGHTMGDKEIVFVGGTSAGTGSASAATVVDGVTTPVTLEDGREFRIHFDLGLESSHSSLFTCSETGITQRDLYSDGDLVRIVDNTYVFEDAVAILESTKTYSRGHSSEDRLDDFTWCQ